MNNRYALYAVVLALVSVAAYAKKYSYRHKKCKTAQACYNDPNCQCYCSEIGGYRDKVAEDKPVYLSEGKKKGRQVIHCFCKQWDIDNFPGPAERK